jgi:CubicO group peptidase (beta-lactamase class C family)
VGYGFADLSANRPAVASTAYLWFSMTKVVTATAALRLGDEGRLDLDAPVGDYVDYLRAPGHVQPSVRQLLTHTAGLGNPLPIRWAHPADAQQPDPEVLLRRVIRDGRGYRHRIGQSARYSNVGYLAAGEVITAAAGMPFQDYIEQAVLRPVGMSHTGYRSPTRGDRATGYLKAPRNITHPLLRRVLPPGVAGDRQGRYLALNSFYVDGPAYGGLVGTVLTQAGFSGCAWATERSTVTEFSTRRPPAGCAASTAPANRSTTARDGFAGPPPLATTGWSTTAPGWVLERDAALPRPRARHRRHVQQHHRLRLRVTLHRPDRCDMVIVGVIALIRAMRLLRQRRTPGPARRDRRVRPNAAWIPPLINYPAAPSAARR